MFTRSESCCLFGVFSLVVACHYFGTLTLGCSSAVVWCGLAFSSSPILLFFLPPLSVTQSFFSSLILHIEDVGISQSDRASGRDTKHRGQLFALPTKWRGGELRLTQRSVKIISLCVPVSTLQREEPAEETMSKIPIYIKLKTQKRTLNVIITWFLVGNPSTYTAARKKPFKVRTAMCVFDVDGSITAPCGRWKTRDCSSLKQR